MKKRILTTGCFLIFVCMIGSAGWVHHDGRTTWDEKHINGPSPGTCWMRDSYRNIVVTADKVLVYADTPRTFNYDHVDTTTNDLAFLGYWMVDAAGIIVPRTDLERVLDGDSTFQGNRLWYDVEWMVTSNGVLRPKD